MADIAVKPERVAPVDPTQAEIVPSLPGYTTAPGDVALPATETRRTALKPDRTPHGPHRRPEPC